MISVATYTLPIGFRELLEDFAELPFEQYQAVCFQFLVKLPIFM